MASIRTLSFDAIIVGAGFGGIGIGDDGGEAALEVAEGIGADAELGPGGACADEFAETGFDEVREVIGYEVPLAIDHVGHISLQNGIRLAKRIEKYVPAWLEDVIPWQYADQYRQLQEATSVPICTGEDIYLKEGFEPLLNAGISVIHPDLLTSGGILETNKIGDAAQEKGIAMAIHMA